MQMTKTRLGALSIVLTGLIWAPCALADDEADVSAVVQQYGATENDLDAQAKMMREDRVYIQGGTRRTDEANNMAIQKATREAGEAASGGKTRFMSTITGTTVAIYGNVAVTSFVRAFNIFPHNQPAIQGNSQWVTLVLVKEGGKWGIAHTHQSPYGGN
jgi:hypothetical protein